MFPTVDLRNIWWWLHQPVFWLLFAACGAALLIGWRLSSRTYWRVLAAIGLAALGVMFFVDGISTGSPPGQWAGQAGLMILAAGMLLDRARRLHRVERLDGRRRR